MAVDVLFSIPIAGVAPNGMAFLREDVIMLFKTIATAVVLAVLAFGCERPAWEPLLGPGGDENTVLVKEVVRYRLAAELKPVAPFLLDRPEFETLGRAEFICVGEEMRLRIAFRHLPVDGEYAVCYSGFLVQNMMVTVANGRGRLELDTRRGDACPQLRAGNQLMVLGPDGSTMLSGALELQPRR